MKLSKRLQTVANKVKKGSAIADIGTDHAYIPIYLVKNGICKYAVASDIRKGPIDIARANIEKYKLGEYIQARISGGLKGISPNEVDTVIIAGMGGELIREILKESKEVCDTVNTFILQPMTAQEELREWLYNNRYRIDDETLVKEEDKLYTVMVCSRGFEEVDRIYYEVGKKLFENKDPLLGEYLDKKINETAKIIESLKGKETENAVGRMEECQEKLEVYLEMRKRISSSCEI